MCVADRANGGRDASRVEVFGASRTSWASFDIEADQPTMRREKVSTTNAT